ncbi:hypothetical protein DPMN_129178 [Dreissena polymorpha]|uniref:Uncharacterized protein n=1 Tax=Dreissena polymorpha TaxID=45954 RepID=A0A9D4H4F0_DREPO|nr:hypothetical protein DPMN_129178 [Dreissena polymorpha]
MCSLCHVYVAQSRGRSWRSCEVRATASLQLLACKKSKMRQTNTHMTSRQEYGYHS